jgi:amino acid transporter
MPKSKCTRSSSGDDKTSSTTCSSHSLKKNVLGVPQVAFFILAIVGPLMTMLGGATFAYLAIGVAVPAAYLISGLIALCFAVGYLALARRLISAGGFVSLIARALGERAGNAAAFVSLLIFNAVLMMLLGAFSTFTSGLFQAMLGIKISWPWCAAALLATGAFLGYRDIELSAKILGFLMLASISTVLRKTNAPTCNALKSGCRAVLRQEPLVISSTYI